MGSISIPEREEFLVKEAYIASLLQETTALIDAELSALELAAKTLDPAVPVDVTAFLDAKDTAIINIAAIMESATGLQKARTALSEAYNPRLGQPGAPNVPPEVLEEVLEKEAYLNVLIDGIEVEIATKLDVLDESSTGVDIEDEAEVTAYLEETFFPEARGIKLAFTTGSEKTDIIENAFSLGFIATSLPPSTATGRPTPYFRVMTTANRITGVAPLAVCFDAVDVGIGSTGVSQSSSGNYTLDSYWWDFGDPNAGNYIWKPVSRNNACGQIAAHVFNTPGTYEVKLKQTLQGGLEYNYSQTITVTDPQTVYVGLPGMTRYVTSAILGGNNNNPGTQSLPWETADYALAWLFEQDGPRRILFSTGFIYPVTASIVQSNKTGPYHIGQYHAGPTPILDFSSGGFYDIDGFLFASSVTDVRIVDVNIIGSAQPAPAVPAIIGYRPGSFGLLSGCAFLGFTTAVHALGDSTKFCNNTIHNCTFSTPGDYGIFYVPSGTLPSSCPNHLALLGSSWRYAITNSNVHLGVSRSVIQGSDVSDDASVAVAAPPFRVLGMAAPSVAEHICITDTVFRTAPTKMISIGPTSPNLPEMVENVLIEGNHFSWNRDAVYHGTHIQCGAKIYVTVRNNIFTMTGVSTGTCLAVAREGTTPAPVPKKIAFDNNTVYCDNRNNYLTGDWAAVNVSVEVDNVDRVLVRNNILWQINFPTQPGSQFNAVISSGWVTLVTNLSGVDPSFAAPPPGSIPASPGDFHLTGASIPAIGTGTALPVRQDYDRNERPGDNIAWDRGAYELTP